MNYITEIMKATVPTYISSVRDDNKPYVTTYNIVDFLKSGGNLCEAIMAPNITQTTIDDAIIVAGC